MKYNPAEREASYTHVKNIDTPIHTWCHVSLWLIGWLSVYTSTDNNNTETDILQIKHLNLKV